MNIDLALSNIDNIKHKTRLPDQGLQINDIVYCEYHCKIGRICRMSEIQEIPDNPRYVLAHIKTGREFLFGVREHEWHYASNKTLKYSRLVKLNLSNWKDLPEYSIETCEIIQENAPTQNELDNCSWVGRSMAQTLAKFGGE